VLPQAVWHVPLQLINCYLPSHTGLHRCAAEAATQQKQPARAAAHRCGLPGWQPQPSGASLVTYSAAQKDRQGVTLVKECNDSGHRVKGWVDRPQDATGLLLKSCTRVPSMHQSAHFAADGPLQITLHDLLLTHINCGAPVGTAHCTTWCSNHQLVCAPGRICCLLASRRHFTEGPNHMCSSGTGCTGLTTCAPVTAYTTGP
jgi:hypothetical protein